MKITSSTSITSMYGTTLIWLIGLRTRRVIFCCPSTRISALPLEDVGELLDERFVANREAVDVVRITLYATTAGIAAKSPMAVAISASAIPGATLASVAWLTLARPRNAFMIPHTVRRGRCTATPNPRWRVPRDAPRWRRSRAGRPHASRGARRRASPPMLALAAMLGELAEAGSEDVLEPATHARLACAA